MDCHLCLANLSSAAPLGTPWQSQLYRARMALAADPLCMPALKIPPSVQLRCCTIKNDVQSEPSITVLASCLVLARWARPMQGHRCSNLHCPLCVLKHTFTLACAVLSLRYPHST